MITILNIGTISLKTLMELYLKRNMVFNSSYWSIRICRLETMPGVYFIKKGYITKNNSVFELYKDGKKFFKINGTELIAIVLRLTKNIKCGTAGEIEKCL